MSVSRMAEVLWSVRPHPLLRRRYEACLVIGSTKATVLETYVEHFLTRVSETRVGHGNRQSGHTPTEKGNEADPRMRLRISHRPTGMTSPHQGAFARLKGCLHAAMARSCEALVEVRGAVLDAMRASDVSCCFFEHCGHCAPVQSLW